jgi:hypothetical protein
MIECAAFFLGVLQLGIGMIPRLMYRPHREVPLILISIRHLSSYYPRVKEATLVKCTLHLVLDHICSYGLCLEFTWLTCWRLECVQMQS